MKTQLNTKRILIFLAITFGISWAGILAFYLTGGIENRVIRPDLALFVLNYVFVIPAPALANAATRLITREGWGHLWLRPKFRRGWPFYLAVWLLPLLAAVFGSLTYHLLFPQSFDPNVTAARNQLTGLPIASEPNPWKVMLFFTSYLMIVQGIVGSIIANLEEFGWRAYLLQKLVNLFQGANDGGIGADSADSTAARKAALLVGVIWSVWHWPGIVITMKFDLVTSILYLLIYLMTTCALSVLLSWATLRSGSVWPAALGHSTFKGAMMLAWSALKGTSDPLLGPGGLIGSIGIIILGLVLLFNRKAFTVEKEVVSESVQAVASV